VKEIIGKRIRKIRESKDLSQENVGGELGMSGSAYSKIERGQTEASTTKLIKIAVILGVDVADFFIDVKPQTTKLNDPSQLYGFATKSDIEELVKMIEAVTKDVAQLKAWFGKPTKPVQSKKK
jgi:transcriptional regulator with XRE-family HTH domain